MQEKDNVIPLFPEKDHGTSDIEKDDFFPWPSTELPQDKGQQYFEYLGKRKTLATYSIMNDPKGWLVLCKRKQASSIQPFVTWYYNAEDNAYYSGHYFDNELDARNDFKLRINQLTIH